MIQNQKFTVTQPTQIKFGVGIIDDLARMVQDLGGSKAFLVVDPELEKVGLFEKLFSPLKKEGIPYEVYKDLEPEPGLELADNGAKIAGKSGCDCVVGIGGGSAMDVAKAVSILLTNGGKAEDYLGLGKITKPGVPKIMVPTTAGTGAEVTFTAVFFNKKTKSKGGMTGNPLYPDGAVLDPELTVSLPPQMTAAPGIDALTHAIEAYVSLASHPVSDIYAKEAIGLISANLALAYANGNNLEARSAMLLGSLLAGKALATAGVGLVHAMSYPLGGMFRIPHGLANAVLLPYVVEYNIIGSPDKFARIAELMGYHVSAFTYREAARTTVEALFELNREVGIPESLSDLDISYDKLEEMADIALGVTRPVENNPRVPLRDDIIRIYEEAYQGW
ncbi:MAG: iron-containing alcohol dehydrogenase [Thermodesulfobacteriota bacterium]